jgi:hypothetical protein
MMAWLGLRMIFGDYRKWRLALKYYKKRGRVPDFDNPTDISEYLMANILYKRNDAFAPLADKVLVKDFVKSKGLGHIVPENYGVWDSASQIDWDSLPEKYALKLNHGSAHNLFCMGPSGLDRAGAVKELDKRAGRRHNRLETHYDLITPKIFAEEFIDDGSGRLPVDYKFLCVKGEPLYIFFVKDRAPGSHDVKFYVFDLDWNHLTEAQTKPNDDADTIARPKNLEAMTEYARTLSRDFDFVRVDLYDTGDRVWFGEMTFTPDVGKLTEFSDSALREMYAKLKA